jgi:hypothetical protein
MGTFIPSFAVPGLPGKMKSLEHNGLCESLYANACSLPPDPTNKIFMLQIYFGFRQILAATFMQKNLPVRGTLQGGAGATNSTNLIAKSCG